MSKIVHCDESNCSAAITAGVESNWVHVERRAGATHHEFSGWDFCCWDHLAAFAAGTERKAADK